jgi:hypothetical protein
MAKTVQQAVIIDGGMTAAMTPGRVSRWSLWNVSAEEHLQS